MNFTPAELHNSDRTNHPQHSLDPIGNISHGNIKHSMPCTLAVFVSTPLDEPHSEEINRDQTSHPQNSIGPILGIFNFLYNYWYM